MSTNYLESMFGLTGQTAVVIGGAGVLGGALCAGLVQAGAHVVVADLTDAGCQSRVESLKALGGKASYCLINVTQRESIENALAEALKQTGRVDILVNSAGVNAGSELNTQDNARAKGIYAARVVGTHAMLYVRIRGSDEDWRPDHSNYHDYREYAGGSGWKVWVALPGNPEVQQAPLKPPLPIPAYRKPSEIDVPDSMIN